MKTKETFLKLRYLLIPLFVLLAHYSYGQYSISGTTIVTQGNTYLYTVNPSGNISYLQWDAKGKGSVSPSGMASANITWNSTGSVLLEAGGMDYFDNEIMTFLSITINAGTPDDPPAPTVQSTSCGQVILERATPPSGVTYYWQMSPTGSTTSYGSSLTKTINFGTEYYLRAKSSSGNWSANTSMVSFYIPEIPKWYVDTDGDGYGDNGSTPLTQCSQPAGYVNNDLDVCPNTVGSLSGCPRDFSDENYVHTTSFRNATTKSSVTSTSNEDKMESISYHDGLGRPIQQTAIRAGANKQHNNLINWKDNWVVNSTGSQPFYSRNGNASENKIIMGTDPYGNQSMLWECINDAASGADGGWNTSQFTIDRNIGYRYSVWVKRTVSQDGRTYIGTKYVNNLNGSANSNPYFWSGDMPNLNEWYLLVGVVHPYDYSGGNSGISGVYDMNGNKVLSGNDFKWTSTVTKSYFRNYLFYATNTSVRQYFYNPILQRLDGTEASIAELLEGEGRDIVTHIEYDSIGRQELDYLPTSISENGGMYKSINVQNDIKDYYHNKYAGEWTSASSANPYSQKDLEDSPLSRLFRQAAPGEDWKMDNNHEIRFEYDTNTSNSIKKYTVNSSGNLVDSGYYSANELYKTVTKDENYTSGTDHSTEEYKDKLGRVILKRTYGDSDYDRNGTISGSGEVDAKHDTYYVYNEFGNLAFVLPPQAKAGDNIPNSTELSELCYQYTYDSRNRLIEKKIPGKEREDIVYNLHDKPVLTQDGVQRAKSTKEWLFTKYDAFGRVAYTGRKESSNSRGTFQGYADNASSYTQHESRQGSSSVGGTTIYYSNQAIPNVVNEIYTVNYYDDYSVSEATGKDPGTVYGVSTATNVKGLPTVTKVKVLDENHWITTLMYYDERGRVIYTRTENPFLGTTDIVENKLDFSGNVIESTSTHQKSGTSSDIVTIDYFTYDHMNRLLSQKQKIGSQAEQIIVQNYYDELGQLIGKGIGGKESQTRLQTIDYKYNVRGWLTDINDINNVGNDLFTFKINYNISEIGRSASTFNELYNGNISETIWKTANDVASNTTRGYAYDYDALNRIRYADLGVKTTGTYNLGSGYDLNILSYDLNGNIVDLYRNSQVPGTSMDELRYHYDTGNKLLKVVESATSSTYKDTGFKDGNTSGNDYSYDLNGNMAKDLNKGIYTITYNYLNLPVELTFGGSDKIKYFYDASGVKLKKEVTESGTTTTTDYAGNYIYDGSNLDFFFTSEGYAEKNGTGFDYVYYLKDHLSSNRILFSDANEDGIIGLTEINQEHNYYPYGLKHRGYNENQLTSYKYKFNGKEFQEEKSLDLYSYDWRHYDPSLAKWNVIDPMADDMARHSPYSFSFSNPVFFVDPDGMMPFGFQGDLKGGIVHEPLYIAATFVNRNGVIVRHINDGDPNIYLVDEFWDGRSKFGLKVIGRERPWGNYVEGGYLDAIDLFSDIKLPNSFKVYFHLPDVSEPIGGPGFIEFIGPGGILRLKTVLNFLRSLSFKSSPKWIFGAFKSEAKWASQLAKRGWTKKQITEAYTKGKQFNAVNNVNKGNSATRYVHPTTGKSIVVDDVTKELLHVGGAGFKY